MKFGPINQTGARGRIAVTRAPVVLLMVAVVTPAHAVTVYVANHGIGGAACGAKTSPCRSIDHAVNTIASDGDTVIVGPGTYGDLDGSGTLGDSPGEETGGFGCMVRWRCPARC